MFHNTITTFYSICLTISFINSTLLYPDNNDMKDDMNFLCLLINDYF